MASERTYKKGKYRLDERAKHLTSFQKRTSAKMWRKSFKIESKKIEPHDVD